MFRYEFTFIDLALSQMGVYCIEWYFLQGNDFINIHLKLKNQSNQWNSWYFFRIRFVVAQYLFG